MSWTNLSKPTGTPYTYTNPKGKETYDDMSVLYDDPAVFYDGINITAWTGVAKPTGNVLATILPGMATGLMIPFTYAVQYNLAGDSWTKLNKPI